MDTFKGKLAVQQRVFPAYRVPFFDALAERCSGGLVIFAGRPRTDESIDIASEVKHARWHFVNNLHLGNVSQTTYFLYQPGLTGWLKQEEPDGLVVEANPRYLSTPAAVRWMRAAGKPVLGWGLAASPGNGLAGGIIQSARKRLFDQLDGLIAYSQTGAANYAAGGFDPGRIFVAPNSADFRPRGGAPIHPVLKDRPQRVLFVGRLQERKRVDLLLQVCAVLPEALQPSLSIVGDGPARAGLQEMAAKIYPRAVFTGALAGQPLDEQFLQADLFILPGTGGLAVQQALTHALPVIVGQGDGSQSQLVREGNGWLIQPNDLNSLLAALTEALSNPTRLQQMGKESFRIARDEVNIEIMVDAFIHALNSVGKR